MNMRFTCQTKDLDNAIKLSKLLHSEDRAQVIMLRAENDGCVHYEIRVAATSAGAKSEDTSRPSHFILRVKCEAKVETAGSVFLPLRNLEATMKAATKETCTITLLESLRCKVERITMAAAQKPEIWPDMTEAPCKLWLDTKPTIAWMEYLVDSMSTDVARVNLNCMCIQKHAAHLRDESDNYSGLMGVTTDGHRLHAHFIPHASKAIVRTFHDALLPARAVHIALAMMRLKKKSQFGIWSSRQDPKDSMSVRWRIVADNISLECPAWNVVFPPYMQVIPKHDGMRWYELDRDEAVETFKAIKAVAPSLTHTARVILPDNDSGLMHLQADNPDTNSIFESELEAKLHPDGQKRKEGGFLAGFNCQYLVHAIESNPSPKVLVMFAGELDPCVIVDAANREGFPVSVVMPMRV